MGDENVPPHQVTLIHPKHHEILIEGLWNCFTMQHGVDFDCWSDTGNGLRAHHLLLELFLSPSKIHTQNIAVQQQCKQGNDQQHQLAAEGGETLNDLQIILEFLYRGRVTVSQECLPKLLAFARKVDFKLLVETVESATKTNRILADKSPCEDGRNDSLNNGTEWKYHIANDFAEPKEKVLSDLIEETSFDNNNECACTPVHLVATSMLTEQADTNYVISDGQQFRRDEDVETGQILDESRKRSAVRRSTRIPNKLAKKQEPYDEEVEDNKEEDSEKDERATLIGMPLEFIKSSHGNNLLTISGFLYSKERDSGTKTFWRCVEARNHKCPGRVHTMSGLILKFTANHNHVPDVGKIGARKVMHEVKERARSGCEAIQQLLDDATASADPAFAARLPNVELMRRSVQRVRQNQLQAVQDPQMNPTSLHDLELPSLFREMKTNSSSNSEPFLLHDSGAGDDRILLFATAVNLRLLSRCPIWYCDGTFRTSPPLFAQLFTVHAVSSPEAVLPCVYALLPIKTATTFVQVLTALDRLHPGLRPATVVTGFDVLAAQSLRQMYPGVVLRGCFFHLGQMMWHKVRSIDGMQTRYSADPDFALQVRLLTALAYVPEAHVVNAFEQLKVTAYYLHERRTMQPLLDFFEDTFVGRLDTRTPPTYALHLWNCYEWSSQGSPAISNAVEAWHRSFDSRMGADRRSGSPNVWKFLGTLKQEQAANQTRIEQAVDGKETEGRKKYRNATKSIQKVVEEYGRYTLIDYLTAIAHNLSLSV